MNRQFVHNRFHNLYELILTQQLSVILSILNATQKLNVKNLINILNNFY